MNVPELVPVALAGEAVAGTPTCGAITGAATVNTEAFGECGVMEPPPTRRLDAIVTSSPPPEVGGSGDTFQVSRIDAMADTARVVEVSRWYEFSVMDEEGPMGEPSAMQGPTQFSVPVAIQRSIPEPATVFVNRIPGPVVDTRVDGRPAGHKADIMLVTHPSLQPSGDAVKIVDGTQRFHVPTISQQQRG